MMVSKRGTRQGHRTVTEQSSDIREWNAESYHRVANPHVDWGGPVLDRLPLEGNETVIDAGCGTGRLTELLLERLPSGQVIALDQSQNMLDEAESYLKPKFGDRVSFRRADLMQLDLERAADAVFSTATFHWIPDHQQLFDRLFHALRPGGWLVAQCGGGPNIARIEQRAMRILRQEPFAEHIGDWTGPWNFADAESTAERLANAGFTDITTNLIAAPVTMPDAAEYGEFLETVVFGTHLEKLPTEDLRREFILLMVDQGGQDHPPFELDYWRLNLQGRRPE
jgi:trans-aconitate 2-methyltransferase